MYLLYILFTESPKIAKKLEVENVSCQGNAQPYFSYIFDQTERYVGSSNSVYKITSEYVLVSDAVLFCLDDQQTMSRVLKLLCGSKISLYSTKNTLLSFPGMLLYIVGLGSTSKNCWNFSSSVPFSVLVPVWSSMLMCKSKMFTWKISYKFIQSNNQNSPIQIRSLA